MKIRLWKVLIVSALFLSGCAGAGRTPSLDEFNDTTPRNQDAINKLEKGLTF